jgi:hypothetical protein
LDPKEPKELKEQRGMLVLKGLEGHRELKVL